MSTPLIRACKVMGTFFRDPETQEKIKTFSGQGQVPGYLEAEPTNEHDPHAVRVCLADGTHTGYVPAVWSGLCLAAFGLREGAKQEVTLTIQANKTLEVYIDLEGE